MARVFFPTTLHGLTGGVTERDVEVPTMRALAARLEEDYPGIGVQLRAASVAIDGDIIPGAWMETLEPDSEIHFLPALGGG
jgi:molybdopterin synthase sulfur carrier subunit